MKKLVAAFFIVVLILGSACSRPDSSAVTPQSEARPFRVAFNTWLGYSALVIARENGYLKESGLDVEITFLEGIGEKNSALIRGDIDAVGHTADSAVTSAAAGVDGQIVYVFDKSYGADGVIARGEIRSVADLRGRRVALEPGFTGHFFFLHLLREAGIEPAEVKVVEMDTGSAGSAFIAGSVDAAVTWEPWIGKTKERKDAHVLVTTADRPGLIIDVLFMNRATILARGEDVDALIRALSRATDWYRANPVDGNRIMAAFWKLPIQEVEATVAGMRFMNWDQNVEFMGSASAPGSLSETISSAAQLWFEAGVIKQPLEDPGALVYYCGSCS